MKNLIIIGIIAVGLFAPQISTAQGTITYLSNAGQTSTGSQAVGSNSWLAALFGTGTNAGGYMLNSVQLAMTDASGNPSGFTALIYSAISGAGINPGSSLGILTGSLNPATGGIYTYTDDSNIMLSPHTYYFIVLTAGTAIANGAYDWSLASTFSYNPSGGWVVGNNGNAATFLSSPNGSSWTANQGNLQFALDATPVPEPSPSLLLLLGSGIFIYVRRAVRR